MEPPFERIGRYWYDLPKEHRNGKFDVVTEDDKGFNPYEVMFRLQPLSPVQALMKSRYVMIWY